MMRIPASCHSWVSLVGHMLLFALLTYSCSCRFLIAPQLVGVALLMISGFCSALFAGAASAVPGVVFPGTISKSSFRAWKVLGMTSSVYMHVGTLNEGVRRVALINVHTRVVLLIQQKKDLARRRLGRHPQPDQCRHLSDSLPAKCL